MTALSATLIKDLREKTGAGMTDCKNALVASSGDIEGAVDWLRKNGIARAEKKAGRVTSEGCVAAAQSADGRKAVLVEVNSETDFVARNPAFQDFARAVAQCALTAGTALDALQAAALPTGGSVSDGLKTLIATLGENITLRRAAQVEVSQGTVSVYLHNALGTNVGKIGVLVGVETSGDKDKSTALGKQVAMHIAAAAPEALSINDVDPARLARERDVLAEQSRASGKPEEIIAKMVEGRLRKYYEEVVLLEQVYVIDGETRVKDVVANAAKTVGAPVSLNAFSCLRLGEGIEKAETDFAAEVASMAKR